MTLSERLDALAQRLMATTEHHQYAQLVVEAANSLRGPKSDLSVDQWRLVPITPTREMVNAGAETLGMKVINGIIGTHCARFGFNPIPELDCTGPEDSALAKAFTAMVENSPNATGEKV